MLGDRAYASDALRQALAERGAWTNVKLMKNCKRTLTSTDYVYRDSQTR